MTSPATDGSPVAGHIDGVSGPTRSPWLRILGLCLKYTAAALVLLMGAATITSGIPGTLSVVYGSAVVVLFFSISLLIGHYAGRNNPSGAIGLFLAAYILKVVGFALVLFALGTPEWLERNWFFVAAVAVVIVWQTAEIVAFSRTRHLLYATSGNAEHEGDRP